MADLMTSIQSPRTSSGAGFADYGRKTRAEMIARLRSIAASDLQAAQAVLDTPDDEFIVEQYRGVWARRDLIRIEPTNEKGASHE